MNNVQNNLGSHGNEYIRVEYVSLDMFSTNDWCRTIVEIAFYQQHTQSEHPETSLDFVRILVESIVLVDIRPETVLIK